MTLPGAGPGEADPQVIEQLEIAARYQGYIVRQQDEIARVAASETTAIPDDLDYAQVRGLSKEVQQRLEQQRPRTIGQAGRLQGVTPAAISLLLIHLRRVSATRNIDRAA